MIETSVTAGGLAIVFLEGVKWLIRLTTKQSTLDIPAKVYAILLPVITACMVPVAALLGIEGYALPTDWAAFAKNIVVVLLASIIAAGGYTVGIKPLKDLYKVQQQHR